MVVPTPALSCVARYLKDPSPCLPPSPPPKSLDTWACPARSSRRRCRHRAGGGGGSIRVSEKTAEKIRAAARELGYRPNAAARATATGRFGAVTLVLSTTGNRSTLPGELLGGIHDALDRAGKHLITATLDDDERLTDPHSMPRLLTEACSDGPAHRLHPRDPARPAGTDRATPDPRDLDQLAAAAGLRASRRRGRGLRRHPSAARAGPPPDRLRRLHLRPRAGGAALQHDRPPRGVPAGDAGGGAGEGGGASARRRTRGR